MAKSYKLLSPGFVLFRPIPPNTKPPRQFREWGRNPNPPIISIGLPHDSDVGAAASNFDAGLGPRYPVNFRAQQLIDDSKG
jgi:hypothetical protein